MHDDPGIQVREVSYAYGSKKALDHISLTVRRGRFTALLGPNGAGKTTLVALLTGLFSAETGEIEVLGVNLKQRPRKALSEMGIVFQQQTLDLDLSVRQNMQYFAALHGLSGGKCRRQIDACLDRMGLADRDREKVRSLSGGYRRRLEIARSLVHAPRCLILDEPTVGLDVPTRSDIVQHVHGLCEDSDLTVLWATHLVDEVWAGDDLIVLHRGRVMAMNTVSEVVSACGASDVLGAFNMFTKASGTSSG